MSRITAFLRLRTESPSPARFFSNQADHAKGPVTSVASRLRLSRLSPTPAWLAGLGLVLVLIASLGGQALAQGGASETAPAATGPGSVVRATLGAWKVACQTPPGAKEEKCALMQRVTAEDRPGIWLSVVFYKSIGENKKLLRVVVPLGVLLPTGLGLKIDGRDVGNAQFVKCSKVGCVAEVVLKDDEIALMKKGTTAMFIIFDTPETGIGIPVALQGFGDALAKLK